MYVFLHSLCCYEVACRTIVAHKSRSSAETIASTNLGVFLGTIIDLLCIPLTGGQHEEGVVCLCQTELWVPKSRRSRLQRPTKTALKISTPNGGGEFEGFALCMVGSYPWKHHFHRMRYPPGGGMGGGGSITLPPTSQPIPIVLSVIECQVAIDGTITVAILGGKKCNGRHGAIGARETSRVDAWDVGGIDAQAKCCSPWSNNSNHTVCVSLTPNNVRWVRPRVHFEEVRSRRSNSVPP